MSDIYDVLQKYNASRDAAIIEFVRNDNPRPFQRHVAEFHDYFDPRALAIYRKPLTCKVTVYKTATAIASLPADVRARAKQWLLANAFRPLDDGDIPTT